MRLQKFLAACGVASRRKSEELIKDGFIKVNNTVIKEMGHKIDPNKDIVTYQNKRVTISEKKIYILLNKPTGYVTTVSDQFNRDKVTDLVQINKRIHPIGRLDYNTSGLLLLTDDGELTYKLTHPKHKVEKVYIAKIKGTPSKDNINKFQKGLEIDNYKTQPAYFEILNSQSDMSTVKIIITEGRNRQVRKMCQAIGHPVISLQRIAVGKLNIGNLELGKWRFLTEKEINYLKKL
ncbi:pseudouridine synthase [Serpentinicella sp. ANB-PHB4]|uniref:pseudouridine synthase n=1 Tax=Serpentinicella sp. ANB-PHB4 TaxID=3074076 RepID=UPI0028669277|nr:pseudouridine synthase [Serpentinicella sp. ANB-PHB4]MDR5658137.1 pseudouridine synthase [Serpentinicella sp. ANB-PHB4]